MGLHIQNTLDEESALHAQTREENDARLRPQLKALREGRAVETLASMAKAYLGLYLDIDSSFLPMQRIGFLVSDDVAEALTAGFVAVLHNHALPAPQQIGEQMAKGERYETGYIVLAAMDHLYRQADALDGVSLSTLGSALCFHYANTSSFQNRWVETVLRAHAADMAPVLEAFWMGLISKGTDHIPGLQAFVANANSNHACLDQMLLPVLAHWSGYKKKLLARLLQTAIRHTDTNRLLGIAATQFRRNDLPPDKRILWLACAFVLQPDNYWQTLLDYTQRSKEKLLPLLDFSLELVCPQNDTPVRLPHYTLARLLRLIAPKFPPHYDSFGNLTDNACKTLRLFYEYALLNEDITHSLQWLQKARVMNVVRELLEATLNLNRQALQGKPVVAFDHFVDTLKQAGKIAGRKGRYS